MNPDGTTPPLNNTGLRPTADKILIEPMLVKKKHGLIELADVSLEKEQLAQTIGTVIAMGETARLCPEMEGISIGDQVLFARYSGAEFQIENLRYRIMRARDVIGMATKIPDSVIRGAQSSIETFGVNTQAA